MRVLLDMDHSPIRAVLCLGTALALFGVAPVCSAGGARAAPAKTAGVKTTAAKTAGAKTAGAKTPQETASVCAPAASPDLCLLIDSGRLPDLRWPDFTDYRAQLKSFYQPVNYQLAWVANGQPTDQARGVIHALEDSEKVGLRATDYDGPSWED